MKDETDFAVVIPEEDIVCYEGSLNEYTEILYLSVDEIKRVKEIVKLYPNLKTIVLPITPLKKEHIGDISNLIEIMKYVRTVQVVPFLNIEEVRKAIDDAGLSNKIIVSDDGISFINTERIEENNRVENLKINLRDIERIGVDKLSQLKDDITIVIDNVSELSVETLKGYIDAGMNISRVKVFSKANDKAGNIPYEAEKYCAIREKLEELVEGIDLSLPEEKKFAEVYRRICEQIAYDEKAGYPETEEDEIYSKIEKTNCRNLSNGLLEGMTVCSGYADILRNALAMVGIESEVVCGTVITKKLKKSEFDKDKLKFGYVYKDDGETVLIAEDHAWNKVKIGDAWYNVDVTWDVNRVKKGKVPKHCLMTDEEVREKEDKVDFEGHECKTKFDRRVLEKLFDRHHIFIGKYKIPNMSDIQYEITCLGRRYAKKKRSIKKRFSAVKQKILKIIRQENGEKAEAINSITFIKSSNKSWDLSNWGIDKIEFSNQTDMMANKKENTEVLQNLKKDNEKIK